MKKALLVYLIVWGICEIGGAQIFSNDITDPDPSLQNPFSSGQTLGPNVSATGIGRGPGINAASAMNRYNASSWSTPFNPTEYFEFTISPNSGYAIDFLTFDFSSQASPTGPTTLSFRSSLDAFVSEIDAPAIGSASVDLSGVEFQNITSTITFRLYAWGGSSAAGTFSVNDFAFDGSTALPIELLSFNGKAEHNAIALSWSTASEIDNDYVEVQKSKNGKDFVTFEKVMGAGDRFEISRYYVKDPVPQKGKNYYRLKQVDFDGTETYSKVISIQFGSKQNGLNIFPTLVLSTLNLETDKFEDLDHLCIYNLAGQKVINDFRPANQVDCSRFPEGSYILRAVFLNGESHSLRFFKKG